MNKVKDEIDIDPVYVKGTFGIYNLNDLVEKVNLDGHYGVKVIKHDEGYDLDVYENIRNQCVYRLGRVLYRSDTEDVLNLINMFAEYTYKDLEGINKCNSVPKVMLGGTIRPTRKELFTYKSKFFVAFGRYIFGYDVNHVIMKKDQDNEDKEEKEDEEGKSEEDESEEDESEEDESEEDEDEFEYWKKKSSLDVNEIILSVPIVSKQTRENDYVYSFLIYDTDTGILDAFGMYR